ncbi:MAG: hypothetical protein NW226_06685 [Microscillaceae bacterium]|nr:hypothetical protein [Microscillaceae bacterium]
MFIPPKKYLDHFKENSPVEVRQVYLKNMHLIVADEVAKEVFSEANFVYLSYKADIRRLFLVSFQDEVFRKLHEPSMQMLKQRGELPEKSIALHEILIDHDLSQEDRPLEYEIREGRKMLVIQF